MNKQNTIGNFLLYRDKIKNMSLEKEVVVESGDWRIRKISNGGEFSHYALIEEEEHGHSTTPFDEVRATGGLLKLNFEGSNSKTFTGVIDGSNTYNDDGADLPEEIFMELKEIGPY